MASREGYFSTILLRGSDIEDINKKDSKNVINKPLFFILYFASLNSIKPFAKFLASFGLNIILSAHKVPLVIIVQIALNLSFQVNA